MATTMTPREHIEDIRKTKFSIGEKLNPLTEDLHQAVKNLSGELYAKDVHFFMELVQNAEDNEYSEGVDPSLEFVITYRDITATGAPATLLVFNNEKGFSPKNIDSICSVGRSTKKGNRKRGYIGEKGIGFKSVFLITAQPYIFSNGYQIRFSEEPCSHCNVGYIVPEWVEQNPTLSDIEKIYGSATALPTTTLILPLKPDKVEPVKKQLSIIHPEVLLFLSKIKRLSVREDKEDPRQNTVTAIEIARETEHASRKNIDAQSYTLHLSAEENGGNGECSYYMWKQKFPVRQEFRVERRMEVDEWVISLAFPIGERLQRARNSSPGVYAFLPTEMVTNFPFIIQADFLLASSRETILLTNKWNQGILECVPTAFSHAFNSLVKTVEGAPTSSLPPMFRFLPVQVSSYKELNAVRESIKAKMVEEDIIPVEPEMEQKFFHKPREVGRLMPAFWSILRKARVQRVSLIKLSSHGRFVLSYSFDSKEYDPILSFLGVEPVNDDWYVKCIQGTSNLVGGVSEDLYLELLQFIAENWGSKFGHTNMKNIPLIKYADYGNESLCSISQIQKGECRVCLSSKYSRVSWLIDCNREFNSVTRLLFMPKATQEAIWTCSVKDTLKKWLADQAKVVDVDVNQYAVDLLQHSLNERKLVIAYVHFLYHSVDNDFISSREVHRLCGIMPLVDGYGDIIRGRKGVIVPANGSKWAGLTDSNLWRKEGYVELGEHYMNSGYFAGKYTPEKKLLEFLIEHAAALDVPHISAPSDRISSVSAPLTKQNAFLLLDWIRQLNYKRVVFPQKFLACIKEGSWLKVTLNGSPGYRPPSQSFLLNSSWGNTLQNGSVSVDIPLIDTRFYGECISGYKEELKTIGVMFEYSEACDFIGKHFMSLAASSSLTRGNVHSILRFIRFLRDKLLSPADFISAIKKGNWLKTAVGYRSPVGSVLSDKEWNVASKISNIPFIDQDFYGDEICNFRTELELLGVVISFNHQLIIDNLKSPSSITYWTPQVVILMLNCMALSKSSDKLVNALKGAKCLKTSIGYKCPGECLLFHHEWGCILQVVNGLPVIDHEFYGSNIFRYINELKKISVVVDFEEAAKVFARYFRHYASSASITKENVASLLLCYRALKGTPYKFPTDLRSCIGEVKWLRSRFGDFRCPRECILFSPEWESISPITMLPFIDDSDSYYGKSIHEYRKELKSLGVVVEYKEGVKFVASGLYLPRDASRIFPVNALALLECIRVFQEKGYAFLDDSDFMKKVSQPWIKTHAGYRSPKESLLFDSKFGLYLKRTDGPFIDEEFYGTKIASYKKELSALGVVVEAEKGCPLIAGHLAVHYGIEAFVRLYNYLSAFKWEPDTDAARRIWISKGEWVRPDDCVIYDKDGLFGLQLTVLEKHYEYEQKLLFFFSSAFRVKSHPSVDDYLKVWNVWESSGSALSHADCCKFWSYISKHWNSKTEKSVSDALVKVPVSSGSEGILLCNKSDVFIADDLQLKYLFEQSSPESIFVWYPQPSLPSIPRSKLLDIYRRIGVRTISESVQKEEASLADDVEVVSLPRVKLIRKALFRLILGFLAAPPMEMEAEKRLEAVQFLVNVTVVVTAEPISVSYNLPLSSGKVLNVRGSRKIRFDRETSKIFTQKMDKSGGQKSIIEFATFFSEVISESVLWESTDRIDSLSELIKMAYLLDFNEEAVDFLMKSKNLQTFMEDEEFLKTV